MPEKANAALGCAGEAALEAAARHIVETLLAAASGTLLHDAQNLDKLEADLDTLRARYSELKRSRGFSEADRQSRVEFVQRQLVSLLADILSLPEPTDPWKVGNEFLPFHPSASHVPPDYRDGWNRCHAAAQARIQALEMVLHRMQDTLEQLQSWARAYPLDVFPEPDLAKAHELLQAGGITLDAVSAGAMRHVITQVQALVDRALAGGDPAPEDRA